MPSARAPLAAAETDLHRRILVLERELAAALAEKERRFGYAIAAEKVRFAADVVAAQRRFKRNLVLYLFESRALAILTAPVIYAGVVPFLLLDLFLWMYQVVCFSVYGIPKARRADYLVFDRGSLQYLNLIERLNCVYCSYANGLFAFAVEIGGRTEQHWCPIRHARRLRASHPRYAHFLEFGDADAWRSELESVRNDFVDLRQLAPPINANRPE